MKNPLLETPWETEPFMINDEGTKFWQDEHTTKYMHDEDKNGVKLEDYVVWYTETKERRRDRIIIDNDKGIIVYGSQNWESLLVHIDMMKMNKNFG